MDWRRLTPRQKVIGGAVLLAGLVAVAKSRTDEDEDLDDVEWVFYRTDGRCFYCEEDLVLGNRGDVGARGVGAGPLHPVLSRRLRPAVELGPRVRGLQHGEERPHAVGV